jgi:hypothetical protein
VEPTTDAGTIAASEVAAALRWSKFTRAISSGTMMIPPPMANSPDRSPPTSPTPMRTSRTSSPPRGDGELSFRPLIAPLWAGMDASTALGRASR